MVEGEKKIIIKEDGTKEEIVISLKPDISDGEGVEEEKQEQKDEDAVNGGLFKKIMMFFSFFLIAVFTGLVFYVQSVVDENLFKNTLNKTFEDELMTSKTKIELTGVPEFKVFPIPHIILRDANIVDYVKSDFFINGTIKTIKIYLNIKQLFTKKIVIEKIDFDELDFVANELSVKAIETPVFLKTESNLKYNFSKGNIKIIGLSYIREFNEISFSLNLDIKEQKHSFSGSLQSNKNEMSVKGNFNLIKEEETYKFFYTKIEMSSQSFNIITEINGTINLNDYYGMITADVNSTQMFIKTIFNTNDFLYQRVIDNSPLKFNSNFDFHNDIFSIRNFTITGKNINGDADGIIHLKEGGKNYINAIFNNIDSDLLLIRNLTPSSMDSKSDIKPNNIFLFNKEDFKWTTRPSPVSYLEKIFASNTTKYNIGIRELLFNKLRITDFVATFSKKNAIIFDKVSAIINETNFFNINEEQKFYFNGTDFNIFFDVKNEKKLPFVISGDINLKHYGKVFFENIKSKIDTDILFLTDVEVQYNKAGIDFFVVDIKFDKLDMKRINDFRENNSNLSSLKANMLFLNNFNINTIYNIKINNISNGKWKDNNYALTLKIRNKKLAIYDLNFNNKIDGKLDINIEKEIPTLSITLNFDNYDYKTNFNFLETIFSIPTMESFGGNLNMTIKNSKYHTSQLNDVDIKAEITDGSFLFKTFDFKDAFGGRCQLNDGFIDLKYNRRLNFALRDCVVSLDQTFYLLAGIKKIHGDVGLALILFAEGPDIENFKTNFLVKGNFIGNGIKVENFAIHTLSENLFKVKFDKKLLFDIKPLDVLFDKGSITVFESVTGNINYQKKTNTALLVIQEKSSLHNGVISGSIDFFPNYLSLKLDSKMNIWAGDIENPIPLLLGIALEGDTGITYSYSANIQQINDYIDALRINNNQKLKNEKEKAGEQ